MSYVLSGDSELTNMDVELREGRGMCPICYPCVHMQHTRIYLSL